jgi:zinc transport system ATP-binding protein
VDKERIITGDYSMLAEPMIYIKDVFFAYNGVAILENVNLSIGQGESVCIVGPNGGGKTTLLKLILGLLRPDRGEIRVLGHKPEQVRLKMGYIPQYAYHDQQFPVSVMDVVLMGRLGHRWGGPYTRLDKGAALDALAEVALADLAHRLFNSLSGGQRQRVLIARALTCTAEMLLLDEPFANVDALVEENLIETLYKLSKRMTILLVTHDLGFISKIFHSVICVRRKVVIHPTSEITGEVIQDIYGEDICMVRHDHRCAEEGQRHD